MLMFEIANQIVRRHNNSVYDRVAISNVTTQIEQAFWFASGPGDSLLGGGEEGVLRVGDDLGEDRYVFYLCTTMYSLARD